MLSKSGQIKDIGRIEARDYRVLSVTVLEKDFDTSGWPGLTTVGVTQSCRQEKSKAPILEQRYYIRHSAPDFLGLDDHGLF